MSISNGYTVDAYCDCAECRAGFEPEMASAAGETYTECATELRHYGWYLSRDRRHAIAPGHEKPKKWEDDK